MARTLNSFTGIGSRSTYPVNFGLGFISREHVYVYTGDLTGYNTQLSYTWSNSNTIELSAPLPSGQVMYIRRVVPRDKLINDYEDGAILRESNLDASFAQALMILEEIQDGFFIPNGFGNVTFDGNNDYNIMLSGYTYTKSEIDNFLNNLEIGSNVNAGNVKFVGTVDYIANNVEDALEQEYLLRKSNTDRLSAVEGNVVTNNQSIGTINSELAIVMNRLLVVENRSLSNTIDISSLSNSKISKDVSATAGNIPVFTADGSVADSGATLDDALTSSPDYIQEELPVGVIKDGARWYVPSEATTYIYYVDVDGGQWVEEAVQSAEGTLREELSSSSSSVLIAGKAATTIVQTFNSVADLKSADVKVGQSVRTLGYYSGSVVGAGEYTIVNSNTGVANDGTYIELTNGLQAELSITDEVKVSTFGVTGTTTPAENLARCRLAVETGKSVHFDIPLIRLPNLARNDIYFVLTSNNSNTKLRGKTRFVVEGTLGDYNILFAAQGCRDTTIEDIHGEDETNKSSVVTSQGGLVYFRVNDLATGEKGCVRVSLVRPAMFGGGALFQPIGVDYGTTANQCSITDGHCEDTYYGINCAQSGVGLKGNIRCIRVKRAYFVYDTSDHDVLIDSSEPSSANAHFLIKTYDPTVGTRDLNVVARVSGTTDVSRGRCVLEHQDEATDNSIIENINLTIFDERDVVSETVFFRAYANPTTVRETTNSVWRNITISGKTKGVRFFSKSSKLTTVDYRAEHSADVGDLFSYARLLANTTYDGVLFKAGLRTYKVVTQGVVGTGAEYTLPLKDLIASSSINSVTVSATLTAYQGNTSSMTNHSRYYTEFLCRYQAGTLTFKKGDDRNGVFTGLSLITASTTVVDNNIKFSIPALGGNQFMVFEFTII